jgi:hypothetical protein
MDYAYLDPTSQECKGPLDALSLHICRQHIRSVANVGAVTMAVLTAILLRTARTLQVYDRQD